MKPNEEKTKSEALKEAEQYIKQLEPKQRFKIIYESVYLNTDLNAIEKGLLYTLITASPNYKPSKTKLMKSLKISERELLKATKTLQKYGYLYIENKGRKGKIWTITQTPINTALYRDETAIIFNEPSQVMELYQQGTISKEQALQRIDIYAKNIKAKIEKDDFNEIQRIIKTKWVNID